MKKIWIALSLIVVIRLVSLAFLEGKLLDEPIILAQDVSLRNDSLYVSYITNNVEPHEISHVEIGDTYLYPNQETDFLGFVTDSTESNEYVRGRIYSVHAVALPLNLENRELNFSNATTAIIHFKNGMQWEEPVTVKPLVNQEILHETMTTISNDQTVKVRYTTEQDVILTKLDVGDLEDVTLAINQQQVALPLKTAIAIPKGAPINLAYKVVQPGYYSFDEYEIIFSLLDENNVPIEISMENYKNNPPSSSWVHEVVKERGTK